MKNFLAAILRNNKMIEEMTESELESEVENCGLINFKRVLMLLLLI